MDIDYQAAYDVIKQVNNLRLSKGLIKSFYELLKKQDPKASLNWNPSNGYLLLGHDVEARISFQSGNQSITEIFTIDNGTGLIRTIRESGSIERLQALHNTIMSTKKMYNYLPVKEVQPLKKSFPFTSIGEFVVTLDDYSSLFM